MKNLICLISILTIWACTSPAPTDESASSIQTVDIDAELAAIEELRNNFSKTVAEKRYGDLGQFTHSDLQAIGPGTADWVEYRKLREAKTGLFSYDSIRMRPYETMILNDSMAYDYGWSSVYYTDAEGNPAELTDTYIVLLKKRSDGKWKLWREVASGRVEHSE